jgi:hypothetical protein
MGVSMVTLTMGDNDKGNQLMTELYQNTLIADTYFSTVVADRTYKRGDDGVGESNRFRMTAIASDDRIAELIELVAAFTDGTSGGGVPFDVVVTPLSGASEEYAEWAKLQTLKKDTSNAFWNVRPKEGLKAITARVGY